MVLIRRGVFLMGSSGDEALHAYFLCHTEPWAHRCDPSMFANEGPPRSITLSDFWLDRTEVTNESYQRCVDAAVCNAPPDGAGAASFRKPQYPVTLVTWNDAQTYCRFRDARLPTEAEFEFAARGRGTRIYPWGNLYNSKVSNHGRFGWDSSDDSDGYSTLAAVGSFPWGATPQGILDLAGNAAEWVNDHYQAPYDTRDTVNPQGPADPRLPRVVRGGSFESGAAWLRAAAREPIAENTRFPTVGFRCARSRIEQPATH
jgi:formylglycine-generating enzyme required for sulfatase activity